MPYIIAEFRPPLNEPLALVARQLDNAGELNYAITFLVDQYLGRRQPTRYDGLNSVIGVLECAKLEFYRRLVAPYEDVKCSQHGDVYMTRHTNGD
jgi:hypothetical protein